MNGLLTTFLGGLALGFAGSLHCACMCGGISSGCMFILNPKGMSERLAMIAKLQTGRVFCYAVAGGIIAGVASLTVNPSTAATSFKMLQWASAALVMWVGLSMAGLVPSIALPGGLGRVPETMAHILAPVRRHPRVMPFALGVTWGLTPCPMVYAALFSAALTGSAAAGTTWMLGFGLGTVPAVVATTLGISSLSQFRKSPAAQTAAGIAIAVFAALTVSGAWPAIRTFCGLLH
jgi:sulfite exporter TauE/SafE